MLLFDLNPIESTSSLLERKRHEFVVGYRNNYPNKGAIPYYLNDINSSTSTSFTRAVIGNLESVNFIQNEVEDNDDYDFYITLPAKKLFFPEVKINSISRLQIIPSID